MVGGNRTDWLLVWVLGSDPWSKRKFNYAGWFILMITKNYALQYIHSFFFRLLLRVLKGIRIFENYGILSWDIERCYL